MNNETRVGRAESGMIYKGQDSSLGDRADTGAIQHKLGSQQGFS